MANAPAKKPTRKKPPASGSKRPAAKRKAAPKRTTPRKAKTKTAFVTGGTGFLGLNLVEQLAAAGWSVTALHRKGSDISRLTRFPVTLAEASLLDLQPLIDAVPQDVDAVFHVAGNTSTWSRNNAQQMKDNVDGTRNMVTAARRKGAKVFVHTSTWNVYGEQDQPLTEESPKRGGYSIVNYDRTKFYAEAIVKAASMRGLRCVIMNPCHILGRYDTTSWSRIIQLAHRNKLPGIPPGSGAFCHAEAVAKAHIAAAQKGRNGENYLLGGPRRVLQGAGRHDRGGRPAQDFGPGHPGLALPDRRAGADRNWRRSRARNRTSHPEAAQIVLGHGRIASDKAARELGYDSPALRVMVEDSYNWLRAEGILTD